MDDRWISAAVVEGCVARSLDARITTGDIPPALQGVLLGFRWRLDRLLALDLPVEAVSIGDLTWLLDLPFWQQNGEWFVVTPNDVRERPQEHREQWSRT
jgi:hypothetical protein